MIDGRMRGDNSAASLADMRVSRDDQGSRQGLHRAAAAPPEAILEVAPHGRPVRYLENDTDGADA